MERIGLLFVTAVSNMQYVPCWVFLLLFSHKLNQLSLFWEASNWPPVQPVFGVRLCGHMGEQHRRAGRAEAKHTAIVTAERHKAILCHGQGWSAVAFGLLCRLSEGCRVWPLQRLSPARQRHKPSSERKQSATTEQASITNYLHLCACSRNPFQHHYLWAAMGWQSLPSGR